MFHFIKRRRKNTHLGNACCSKITIKFSFSHRCCPSKILDRNVFIGQDLQRFLHGFEMKCITLKTLKESLKILGKIALSFSKQRITAFILAERYYELYPPQSSQIGESEKQTSSANITWVGIAIATLVALVLVLALIAAMYFRLKAKKNMPRSPPPMYPERNGFVNPNFARSEDNLTYQDGRVSLAPVSL